jgi:hypothetical protein
MERPLTAGLIALNVAVFLLVFSMPQPLSEQVFEDFSFSRGFALEVWRWFTSLFLHVTASHLFFNMLGLYFFGKILEDEVPRQWFLSVYFVSGLLGNLVFMFTSSSPVVGASGAMFGIMGAAMLLNPIKRAHLYVFPLPLGIIAITFVIFETLVVYFQPREFANIANISHVAGILTGALFALFYSPKRAVKGIVVLIVSLLLLIVLGPLFGMITGIGSVILRALDFITGLVLYGLAGLLSFIWT